MRGRSKVVFFKAGRWSDVVHLAGDASPKAPTVGKAIPGSLILGVLPRTKSRRPEAKPLARQTTHDHLPTCIMFLAGSGKAKSGAKSKDKNKAKA